MNELLAARGQMAFSLGFHMIFAALGVGMPMMMMLAERRWLQTRDESYRRLARTWAKATGLTFAIGAVSGTALSFELGLLWPRFMEFAGPAIGPAFTLEAFAFFLEAIFLGLYLYGWDRLSPRVHWWAGVPVAVSGAASSVLVVSANAWMQNPQGAELLVSNPAALDPLRALFANPTWVQMAIHSTLATYAATAFAVAGVYAWGALHGRRDAYHRNALRLAAAVALVVAVLMPLTGDRSAKLVARQQPAKLAAMESQFVSEEGAPLRIGGWPDVESQEVRYALEIPGGLSWLAFGSATAPVTGLDQIPRDEWPNVPVTHLSFQVMVGAGFAMLGVALWFAWVAWRRKRDPLGDTSLLWAMVAAGPLGFIALETGWIVTEVGRQPWTVYGVMRTAEAVTPAAGIASTFLGFVLLYLLLGATLVWLLLRLRQPTAPEPSPGGSDEEVAGRVAG
ncbi:cytochrome ubiquinol oxidase subunit I [Limnochorda pilosa]|uniref:Cytochrome BD ubiquinol oxidase subunit I n=1 Tax=Limnochorda pilosa TaxID=1555112 RepID=A0A0K2SHA5_LIMPI|nr:cytochrome BD ubiquinol oxidase subunit I [Limnochorda pilosa]